MKKLLLITSFVCFLFIGCKKDAVACYECQLRSNGNDTLICDKTKKQLDAMQGGFLIGGDCAKHN